MAMQVAAAARGAVSVGNTTPAQELQERQTRTSEAAWAAQVKKFEAALPGNDRSSNSSNMEEIEAASEEMQTVSLAFNRKLQFVVDHDSQQILVKVIDRETDKVIKVLPPEELQRLHKRIKETIGFLFDEKV